MKKTLVMLMCLFATLAVSAQRHFSFMGVPLGGPLDNFTRQLCYQGLRPDYEANYVSQQPYFLDGTFYGNEAFFRIYYNTRGRFVYGMQVQIYEEDATTDLKQVKDEIRNVIQLKYKYSYDRVNQDGHLLDRYSIFNAKGDQIGLITLNLSYSETMEQNCLSISYFDYINLSRNQNGRYSDI